MKKYLIYLLSLSIFYINTYTYAYKLNPIKINISNIPIKKPEHIIAYLVSISDYTIISIGNKDNELGDIMNNYGMKTYFTNLEELENDYYRKKLYEYIRFKYKNIESGEDIWLFNKGFFIGSRNEINKLIKLRKREEEIGIEKN